MSQADKPRSRVEAESTQPSSLQITPSKLSQSKEAESTKLDLIKVTPSKFSQNNETESTKLNPIQLVQSKLSQTKVRNKLKIAGNKTHVTNHLSQLREFNS